MQFAFRSLAACVWLCAGWLALATNLSAGEPSPDRDATRKEITARIAQFNAAKKPASLGLLKEIINLSISYGAVAYDEGDREACYLFYGESIDAVLSAFEKDETATADVRAALLDLKNARASAKTYNDPAKQAWALRYGFDKVLIAWGRKADHQALLVGLGSRYFQLGLITQARDALHDACAELAQVAGTAMEEVNFSGRLAPIAYARVLLSSQQYDDAAKQLSDGLRYLPDWPTYPMDPSQFYGDEADHAKALHALEAAVEKDPDNIALSELLGVEYFLMNRKAKALVLFKKIAAKDAGNLCVAAFLKTYLDSEYQKDLGKTVELLASRDRDVREGAFGKLSAAGRFALPSLLQAKRTTNSAQVASLVRDLLRRLGENNTDPGPGDQEY